MKYAAALVLALAGCSEPVVPIVIMAETVEFGEVSAPCDDYKIALPLPAGALASVYLVTPGGLHPAEHVLSDGSVLVECGQVANGTVTVRWIAPARDY